MYSAIADTFVRALRWKRRDAPRFPIQGAADTRRNPPSNDPADQRYFPRRDPMLYPLTFPVQNAANGTEVKQAGAGRPVLMPYLTFDVQTMTPEPDRRIIARPMPSSAVDERQVIR